MDGWLKALVATACMVIIIAGAWLALAQYNEWSRQREIEAATLNAEGIRDCSGWAREYSARLAGQRPATTDNNEVLVLRLDGCAESHPDTTRGLGQITVGALDKASALVEGRSVSVMDKKTP